MPLILKLLARRPVLLSAVIVVSLIASLAEGVGIGVVIALFQGESLSGPVREFLSRSVLMSALLDGSALVDRVQAGALVLFVAMLVRSVFYYASRLLATRMEAEVVHDLRAGIFEQLLAVEVGYLHRQRLGNLFSTLVSHTDACGILLKDAARSIVDLFTILVYTTILLWVSWQMTALTLVLLLAVSLGVRTVLGRRLEQSGLGLARAKATLNSVGLESLAGIEVVHIYGQEQRIRERFGAASRSHVRELLRQSRLINLSRPLFMTANALALSGLIYAATILIPEQTEQWIGYAILLLAISFRLMAPAAALNEAHNVIENLSPSLREVLAFLEQNDKPYVRGGSVPFESLQAGIRFDEVTYRYDASRPSALQGASFEIPKGKTTALVGPSGAGKSTVVNLLARLHDYSDGRILVDGVKLEDLELASWRSCLAVVGQECFLFNDTIRANLVFAAPGATDAKIQAAARLTGAEGFIEALPNAYETMVGNRGLQLSAGQRQLIALTRAALIDPEILILDEATSQLDPNSETIVLQAVEQLRRTCTVLVVAHRLSTVRDADQIVVLAGGRVVESGGHGDLLAEQGLYAKMIAAQTLDHFDGRDRGASSQAALPGSRLTTK